jgi:hypothetical protein
MANKTISTSESKINELQIQTSTYGRPIYLLYGRNRLTTNILDYVDFTAIASTTESGGK